MLPCSYYNLLRCFHRCPEAATLSCSWPFLFIRCFCGCRSSACVAPIHQLRGTLCGLLTPPAAAAVVLLQPRSRRLQAIARRSSRRTAPRSLLEFLGVSWRLLRRLARLPFTPWKALRSEGSCIPVSQQQQQHACAYLRGRGLLSRAWALERFQAEASASLSQRKEARQPRRRAQRIKAKERPSVCTVHCASSTTAAAGAAAAAASASGAVASGSRLSEAKGGGGSQQAAGVSSVSGKETSSRKYTSWRQQPRLPSESQGEGCVVSLSPASSCCAASITSDSRSGRTCSSSSGPAEAARHRAKRLRETAGSSSSARSEAPLLLLFAC
ncbi:hypothetical protein Esti_002291 [Eimeria stiedai]